MNRTLFSTVCLVLALFALGCGAKKEDHAHDASAEAEWKEMDEFHMIMAETFHPYKDSANLQPVKAQAEELKAAAEKWVQAPLPEKVDNEKVKEMLSQLNAESATLAESVNGGADDAVVGEQLTRLHDTFHRIQEAWYGGNGDGHQHDHH